MALRRAGATEAELRRIFITQKEYSLEHLKHDLHMDKSPGVVFIDSLQVFYKLYGPQFYIELKEEFGNNKLFVYVSQADGEEPRLSAGVDVKYMADVKMQVKGFRVSSQSRIEGATQGAYHTIWEEGAAKYWGDAK
jgi:hypothetical protein